MIRNNLSLLLTEKQLRITKVSKATGLSRTTLTALAQNTNKMVQMDTVNILCNYLEVSVAEFFEHVPFDFTYSCEVGERIEDNMPARADAAYNLSGFLNVSNGNNQLAEIEFSGLVQDFGEDMPGTIALPGNLRPKDEHELNALIPYLSQLSASFYTDVKKQFERITDEALVDADLVDSVSDISQGIIVSFK